MTLIYAGNVCGGKHPLGLYPRGFVGDVGLVEGCQARSLFLVKGVPVAWGRCGWAMRSIRRHIGEERLAWGGACADELLDLPVYYQLRGGPWHVSGVEVVFAHVVGKYEDYVGLWSCRLGEATLLIAGSHAQANEQAYQRDQPKVFISPSHDFSPS